MELDTQDDGTEQNNKGVEEEPHVVIPVNSKVSSDQERMVDYFQREVRALLEEIIDRISYTRVFL